MAEKKTSVQVVREENPYQKFSTNLKKTNLGVKLSKAVFSKGNVSMGPRAIANALRLLGLNIPKDVEIGVDIAQILISGQAVYNAYQVYQNVNNARNLNNLTRVGIGTANAAIDLSNRLGWTDEKNQYVQMVQVGLDVGAIYASGGWDAGAWISLGLRFTMFEAWNSQTAQILAQKTAGEIYKGIITPQAAAASEVFKRYQQDQEKDPDDPTRLSVFGFIGSIAKVAPDLFPQYFPQYDSWAPVQNRAVITTASSTTWYGSTSSSSASRTWRALPQMSDDQIRNYVFYYLAYPYVFPFLTAEKAYLGQGKVSLFTLALMSTLTPGMQFIHAGKDMSKYLDQSLLTPFDFKEMFFQNYFDGLTNPNANIYKQSGVVMDHQALSKKVSGTNTEKEFLYNERENFKLADQYGDMEVLRYGSELPALLREKFTFNAIPPDEALGVWNETTQLPDRGGGVRNAVGGPGADWRVIKNYFAALGLLHTIKRDPFFKGWNSNGWLDQFDFLKDIETFETQHRRLQWMQTVRAVNLLALNNIAGFMGTTPENLKRTDYPDAPTTYERIK